MTTDYTTRFTNFIRLCEMAKAQDGRLVTIAQPWVLGDTYEEVMQSLSLLAEQGLPLAIARPQPGYPSLSELTAGDSSK